VITAAKRVVSFVHEADARLTIEARIQLYRAFAKVTSSENLAAHFHQCADDLEAAEARCGQRVINFASEGSDL